MDQQDLYNQLEFDILDSDNAPILDLELELISTVNRCIRSSGLGRDRFLDRVNLCLRDTGRKKVTKNALNKWLASSQENCIPGWVIPAMCWALGNIEPLSVLCYSIDRKPIDMRADKLRLRGEMLVEDKIRAQKIKELDKDIMRNAMGVIRGE